MLNNIRALDRQLKLKSLLLSNFVPQDAAEQIESRARWNDETETFDLPRLEIAGNSIRPRRAVSAGGLKRPETDYARNRRAFDSSSRYRADNILATDLDPSERTTEVGG